VQPDLPHSTATTTAAIVECIVVQPGPAGRNIEGATITTIAASLASLASTTDVASHHCTASCRLIGGLAILSVVSEYTGTALSAAAAVGSDEGTAFEVQQLGLEDHQSARTTATTAAKGGRETSNAAAAVRRDESNDIDALASDEPDRAARSTTSYAASATTTAGSAAATTSQTRGRTRNRGSTPTDPP
jgi:hypothetical protein